jgi:SAM-dependent methyltransferase
MKFCLSCQNSFSSEGWKCPSCGAEPKTSGDFLAFAPEFETENPYFPHDSFEKLAGLAERHFWFRSRNEFILWALRKWFVPEGKFLEIGCGTAFVLFALERAMPGLELYGSEIDSNGLKQASRHLKKEQLFQMDARRIPYWQEFDLIGMFDVLEHIPEDETVLSQVHSALKPGGGLILTVPQHAFLWSYVDEISHHMRRYKRADLVAKVRNAGFEVLGSTSFVSLLMPALLVSRIGKKEVNASFDPDKELKIHPWINAVLGLVLRLERQLIRMGVRFPFGGSLILAARKV